MAQLMEILGKGLVGSLWSIFGKDLIKYHSDPSKIKILLTERPDAPELLIKAAVSCYRNSLFEQGLNYAERLCEIAPDMPEARYILACILERLGRRKSARKVLEDYVSENRDADASVYFAIGFLYETAYNIQQAEYYYNCSLEIADNLYNAHQRLAAIKFKQGQIEQSAEHYRQLCKIDPEDIDSRLILAGILLNAGKAREASAEYQIALTIEPDNWTMENETVNAYIKAHQYYQAIELLNESLEKQGEFPDIHLQLAELYAKVGKDELALQHFRKTLEIHPGYLEAMIKLGTYHIQKARYTEAAKCFSQAIEINDRLLNAYVGLAIAQYHLGQDARADETVDLAGAIEPNSSMLFAEVARLELKASAADEARDYLTEHADNRQIANQLINIQTERFAQAIETHPERADWNYRLGLLLKAQGKLQQAAHYFQQAVEINPDYVKALVKLGLVLKELGQHEQARQYLERAVILEPSYSDVHYQLGLVYANQSQYQLAIEHFQKSLESNGQNIDAMSAMAQALENIGLHSQASLAWQSVIELAPDDEKAKLAKTKTTSIK